MQGFFDQYMGDVIRIVARLSLLQSSRYNVAGIAKCQAHAQSSRKAPASACIHLPDQNHDDYSCTQLRLLQHVVLDCLVCNVSSDVSFVNNFSSLVH